MKTVTCFIPGTLRDETLKALLANSRNIELRINDPDDDTCYGKTIREYWRRGEDFMVVEPDVVIRNDVMIAAENCSCEYGCFPYAWMTNVGPALGCTWFRSSFLKKYPDACDEAGAGQISWRQFDVILMRSVLARKYKEQPHVHLPEVVHLNEAKALLPDADPTPMMEVPEW